MCWKPLRVEHHPSGPRVYVFGLRIHHGLACAAGLFICVFGMWDDRHDFPWISDRPHEHRHH